MNVYDNASCTSEYLNTRIDELEEEVYYLRSLITAYENIAVLSEKEQLEDKLTICAYEKLADFAQKERKDLKSVCDAYEKLVLLHSKEKEEAESTIQAMENVSELSRNELKQYRDHFGNMHKRQDPLHKEILAILNEDSENEQNILMKLNLLNQKHSNSSFYSHLFNVLVNLHFDEKKAKKYWKEIIKINQEVSNRLGRQVSFRVSMLDYFIDLNKHLNNPKIIEFRFYESTVIDAMFDKLTGLLNRSQLSIALRSCLQNAQNENHKLGIIMFDVDNFKKFNDFFGHIEGDKVLRDLGKIFSGTFRIKSTTFRYGGEEFLVIMDCSNVEDIFKTAENVRIKFYDQWKDCIIPISLSGGFAVYPDDAQDQDELISKADQALYDAKYSGKNLILQYSEKRRRNSRLFTIQEISYCKRNGNGSHIKAALTMDISHGGLAIETDEPLNINDNITIYFKQSRGSGSAEVEGTVCWIKKIPGSQKYILGIELVDRNISKSIYLNYGKNIESLNNRVST